MIYLSQNIQYNSSLSCICVSDQEDEPTEIQECVDLVIASALDQPWYNDPSVTKYPPEFLSEWNSCWSMTQSPTQSPTYFPEILRCENEVIASVSDQPWYNDDLSVAEYPIKFQFQLDLCRWPIEKLEYATEVQKCFDEVYESVPDQPWYNDLSVTEYPQEFYTQRDACWSATQSPTQFPTNGAADETAAEDPLETQAPTSLLSSERFVGDNLREEQTFVLP
mmetsp:Transcript_6995/g.17080  ORF Transcript_6995/g.17080 Transcript_6995/m.17080 type:complete len:222 (-) Transcript_6995:234-899(-)